MKISSCFCVSVLAIFINIVHSQDVTQNPLTTPDPPETHTKILVHPDSYATSFSRPPRVKPTTAQVAFEAGVPPGSTRPPRPQKPTLRPKPTDFTPKLPVGSVVGNYPFGEEADVDGTTLPPGVLPPEPVVAEPDRGVVDWFLGLFRPGEETTEPSAGASVAAPAKACSKCSCGLTYKHNRIVGGVETQVNEYPWMVYLLYSNRFYCGASLINNKYVLTAGHCVNGFSKDRLVVVFLDHDRATSSETKTFNRRISKVLRHRSYGSGGSYNNDIALLQLEQEVPLTGLIKPVCLPPTGKSFTGHKGVVTGWGATQSHGQVSNKLREVEVPIISNIDCKRTGYGQRITDNMMCAGYPQGQKDSCQGDSGGPMHVINGSSHIIVGIVSWGEGCAQPNYPGVYTRVNRYISWINSNTRDACYCGS